MRASFVHGIRFNLLLVALGLLVLPWLAAQFIGGMERSLRAAQEQAIGANARAVAAALSDRPALFDRARPSEPEEEERRRIVALFAAADTQAAASLGAAYVPSEEIERLLQIMGRRGARFWVIDARSRVRGLWGSLAPAHPPRASSWMKSIATLIVPTPRVAVGEESRPVREQIDHALIGVSGALWRGTVNRDVAILSAAQPIFVGDDIVGAAVVEETTDSIQIFKENALEKLLAATLLVVAAALVLLLAFAGRLATRIRRLHREAERAIDPQGRVTGTVTASSARDEIGDLSRTLSTVMGSLKEYNAYLEAMAGRLSHELRTPVAVVRSSLDNLKAQPLPAGSEVYVERAGEGVDRLSRLISRLSEGTRLERMLESAERERFDVASLVAGCVEGYRLAYPERRFDLDRPAGPLWIEGVPDAVAQLVDKLAENAHDFAPAGSPIRFQVNAIARGGARLAVENAGPPLPEAARARLFDSMVSLRAPGARGQGAHLGLGLYIVRIVAEFHRGSVRAVNLPEGAGVRFEVELP
jgi:dedicated sortase system histidine kinase